MPFLPGRWFCRCVLIVLSLSALLAGRSPAQESVPKAKTTEIPFKSHDGYPMLGKLTLPASGVPRAVLLYVQTAEGMTVDMKRPDGRGGAFNYFDLYREKLPEMGVAFFSYEGRGVRMGDKPPRYEEIDRTIYDTSTLDNKVRDVSSAAQTVRKQPACGKARIFLMGASEGTLLAAEAASRTPREIDGLILYGVMSDTMRGIFRYILTDGSFLHYRRYLDADKDGKVSKAELDAAPAPYRDAITRKVPFETLDRDHDGFLTVEDIAAPAKPLLDAVDKEDYALLDLWAKNAAGVSTPKDWFKDHFHHATIWTFLSKLDVPVGIFHGSMDLMTPIGGARKLEEQAKMAGKSNLHFYYFDDLDHSLGIGAYFRRGMLPAGHKAIFEFIKDHAAR